MKREEEHGAQDRTWAKPIRHRHNGAGEACWPSWSSERTSRELQVRQGREKPHLDSQTRRQTHTVRN